MAGLERAYRRLLLAYPAHYRRRHGAELVTTLLEMSPPGRSRPLPGDAWHLVVAGLRQRFRLPARRPVAWLGALLATLTLGAFGAAAGSWLAARTDAGLPSREAFSAVSRLAGDGIDQWEQRDTTPHTVPAWWSVADDAGWSAGPARARLAAAGWSLTAERPLPDGQNYDAAGTLTRVARTTFDGTRGGLHLRVFGDVTTGHALVEVHVWPEATALRRPLTITGAVLGLLTGWPLAATLAYRLRRAATGRARLAAALLGAALAALVTPAAACYANLGLMVRAAGADGPPVTVHSAFTAGPFETWGWPWMVLQLSVAGLLLALSGIAVAVRGPAEELAARPALT